MTSVGKDLVVSTAFAAAGGLVMGGAKMVSTVHQSKKEGGKFRPDWSSTVEAAVVSARAAWTSGGFAAFLFPNALKFGIGRGFIGADRLETALEAGGEAAKAATRLISENSRLAQMMTKTGTHGLMTNRWGQAAVLGGVVGLAGGMAVFCQRLTDTAMTKWKKGKGFKPDFKASAKSAWRVGGIGLLAGGAASFLLSPLLTRTV